ncbi:MAG: hypothetical protein K0S38_559 [Candidatus Paceibacter sp.]|jgi:hypothetical protein|nr:hypothetical protein [Candidatus Paceibacter sp.]
MANGDGRRITILIFDDMMSAVLVRKINEICRVGNNVILAFDDLKMYARIENEGGLTQDNEDYNEHRSANNAIQLLDSLEPDLILLGYHQGEGPKKALMFGKRQKANTVVLINEPLPTPEADAVDLMGFRRFCLRRDLINKLETYISDILQTREVMRFKELQDIETKEEERRTKLLSPVQ